MQIKMGFGEIACVSTHQTRERKYVLFLSEGHTCSLKVCTSILRALRGIASHGPSVALLKDEVQVCQMAS